MGMFSIFDPYSALGAPSNWSGLMLVIFMAPSRLWAMKSRPVQSVGTMVLKANLEFKAILTGSVPGSTLLCLTAILMVAFTNSTGLLPYVFTSSSHLVFCAGLAIPLWLGHMVMASLKSTPAVLAHLVPSGSPLPLAPFMVVIELISNIIRPLTLSVRLTANMVAGHLLLSIISSVCPSMPHTVMALIIIPLILLMSLETAVAVIQAYVFSVLNALYVKEVDSHVMSA